MQVLQSRRAWHDVTASVFRGLLCTDLAPEAALVCAQRLVAWLEPLLLLSPLQEQHLGGLLGVEPRLATRLQHCLHRQVAWSCTGCQSVLTCGSHG